MTTRFGRFVFLTIMVLTATAWIATPTPVVAECMAMDPWPSFTEAARTAKRIIVGEVVESYADDSAGNAIWFRVRVDEVLRGQTPGTLDFRGGTRSGAPLTVCPRDSILRVRLGDVLAFAFDARVSGAPDPVLAVAWIRGTPHDFLMPGAESLSLGAVRQAAGLPPTDNLPDARPPAVTMPVWPVLAGAFGAFALLLRVSRRTE